MVNEMPEWIGLKYPKEPRNKMRIVRYLRNNEIPEETLSKIVLVNHHHIDTLEEMGCEIISFKNEQEEKRKEMEKKELQFQKELDKFIDELEMI